MRLPIVVLCFVTASSDNTQDGPISRDYNPCCSMPCKHKGICIPLSSVQYECDCPKGYYGRSCEKSSWFKWFAEKVKLEENKKQNLALSGKLIWGLVNNVPLLHETALRYVYMSGSDLGNFNPATWDFVHDYSDFTHNKSTFGRGLPPVPLECPTPLGIKGPRYLPETEKVFQLLFERKEFKPCPLGTNLMFVTFTQYLAYQFFKMNFPDDFLLEKISECRVYGLDGTSKRALRSFQRGKLKARIINGEEYPPYLEDVPEVYMCYPQEKDEQKIFPKWAMNHKMFGITPFMFATATVWLREHNRVCDVIAKEHPDWSDERIYQTARWIILGELITITAGEYFQHLAQYRLKLSYKPQLFHDRRLPVSTQMEHEFSLIFQWHQMMPDVFSLQGTTYNLTDLMFGNNRVVFEHGLDGIVDSMSRIPAGQITYRNCGKTFKNMMKLLIEEGRKTRLHSLNDYRRFYDLKPYNSFLDLVGDKEIAEVLEKLYEDIDAVEFIVGIFLEKHRGSVVPPTMILLTGPVALRTILNSPIGSPALWRPSTFGGKTGFDLVQKATLKKLFCLNLKGNCKNNVWVSFRTPSDVKALTKKIHARFVKRKLNSN